MASSEVKVHHFKAHDLPFVSVTVYNDRAEVKRKLKTKIESGTHEVLIEGISENVNHDSVRVDGHGPASIHEVQFQCKPALAEDVSSPRIKKLEEERKSLNNEKLAKEDLQKVVGKRIEALEQMVVGQVSGGGAHSGEAEKRHLIIDDDSLASVDKLFDFYEKASVAARKSLRDVNEEVRKINEQIQKLDAEIGEIRCRYPVSRNVSVLVESEQGGDIELDVSYQVWGARWFPSYDIRVVCVDEEKSKMKVTYYGNIQQSSGEDWNEVPVILSTAQPSLGGNIPELGTLNAVFYKPPPPQPPPQPMYAGFSGGAVRHRKMVCAANVSEEAMRAFAPELGAIMAKADTVSAGDTVLSTVFSVPRPATIPSDSSEHKVTITIMDLSPKMLHETVPSKNTNVFLMASLINETNYPFLAGEASVYLDNSFVAKTHIKSVSPGERFECSLGVDQGVKVDYKPAHKYREQIGLLTKSTSTAHEQKIVVKNTKKEEILLTVKEHLPKSTDEKIKINLLSPRVVPDTNAAGAEPLKQGQLPSPGARLNKANNLEWTIQLKPNKEAEMIVKWSVEHPAGETVEFQEVF